MDAKRWKKIEDLFDRAADLPVGERAVFLDAECEGDAALRRELDVLLKAEQPAATFLGGVVGRVAADAATAEGGNGRIGPYTIVRQIASGGMGAVYLAERSDEYRQKVAIKLIRPGLTQAEVVRRFRAERQILANLQHPNIARLLDGGVTESGSPYLVMEFVEGIPIDAYCREQRLSIEARVELIHKVCAAVQYAHQNLVIHRDIKPGNILVTPDGVPKLLDFGIAKLLRPDAVDHTLALTGVAERLMTPEYASPEQVRGLPITTATDVYSLGVVLYEILTASKPYQFATRALYEMEKVICEAQPAAPSAVATADSVALRGDLDNIVLMAMRKEPERRYASVADLAVDLHRFEQGYPVAARKGSWSYSAGKFLRRNRLAVGAFAMFVVVIVGLAGRMTVLARRAERERDRALQEERTTQQVAQFLIDLFKVADPETARGKTISAREVLDAASARISDELRGEPAVQARMFETMGKVYENLGDWQQSYAFLEQALSVRRKILPSPHEELAVSLKDLSELARRHHDLAKAEALARESLEMRRKLHGERHGRVAESENTLALALHEKGDLAGAEALLREALSQRGLLGPLEHLETAILSNLGAVLKDEGKLKEAEQYLLECVDVRRRTLGDAHPRLALALGKLAAVVEEQGRFAEAEPMSAECLQIRRKSLGDAHPLTETALRNLGNLRFRLGRLGDAEQALRQALVLEEKTRGAGTRESAAVLSDLGRTVAAAGRMDEAERLLRDAVGRLKGRQPEAPGLLIEAQLRLARLLAAERRGGEARALLLDAKAIAPAGSKYGREIEKELGSVR